jgi:predicted AlkP superfamily pyrophosphatase or phosphodiesterase
MKKCFLTIISIAISLLFFACSPKPEQQHVIFIGLDGWGSYCMSKAEMPNTKQLMENGAYNLKKRSVLPSSSAVNWASMFMGVCPELHGYTTWGSKTPEIPSRVLNKNGIFPTVFQLLREQSPDAEIGCVYEWEGIKYVIDTLSFSYHELVPAYYVNKNAATCQMAEKYITDKKPDIFAIIFDEPDQRGHSAGHDSDGYYEKVKQLDGYIGKIIQATKEAGIYDNTIFIVTGDHGGIKNGHGGKTLMELESPFIISGKNIKKMGEFKESMMQFDIASVVAYAFGLKQPQVWIGRPMEQIFEK